MKGSFRHIVLALAALVTTLGCHRTQLETWNDVNKLNVYVYIPQETLTRAETGQIASDPETEKNINTLQIWVFRHSDGLLIGYLAPSVNNLRSGGTERYAMFLDDAIVSTNPKPNVDIYALANADAAGFAFTSATTRAQLDAAIMDGNAFGITNLQGSVPVEGLPFSGVGKDLSITGNSPVFRVEPVITLTRTVSKLRFLFAQLPGEDGNALQNAGNPVYRVQSIVLDGGAIATQEYLFNDSSNAWKLSGHESAAISFPVTGLTPAVCPTPSTYLYNGQDAQTYENLVQGGITGGQLTEWARTYLRESDLPLSGTITYSVNGVVKNRTFQMDAPGDFARNHSWTVYAYFIGGKLYVQPTVLPWIAGHDRLSYSTMGSTEMKYQRPWLRYDLDMKSWTWDDTYVAIAYGYRGGNSGVPTRSPRITFETLNSNELRLQLNNSHFRLVKVTHSVDGENNAIEVFTQLPLGEALTIPGSNELQVTEVYVVPENDDVMSDPFVKLMLTEMHPGGIPPENLPFNHNLPGDEDHACIRYYNPGMTEYDNNKDNPKVSGDQQPYLYWLEEVE